MNPQRSVSRRWHGLPAQLRPEQVEVIVDTREKQPWDLTPLRMTRAHLDCGDYALAWLPNVLRIERKSLVDLLGCVGQHRARFDAEMHRMMAFPCRMLIIEASWRQIEEGDYGTSLLRPNQVRGSLDAWQARGVSVVLAGNRDSAQRYARRILLAAAQTPWRKLRSMAEALQRNLCHER